MRKDQIINEIFSVRKSLEMLVSELLEEEDYELNLHGWKVKDFIAHFVYWDIQGTNWIKSISQGNIPEIIFAEETSIAKVREKQAEINLREYLRNKDKPLDQVLQEFQISFQNLINIINQITNDQMSLQFKFNYSPKLVSTAQIIKWRKNHYVSHYNQLLQRD